MQWLGIGELGDGLASGLSPFRADRLRYADFETDSFNDAPDALDARAAGAFRAAGWRQEADGAWVSAEGAGAGATVDLSDSGVGTRAGANVAAASDYLAFADLAVGMCVEASFGGENRLGRVEELGRAGEAAQRLRRHGRVGDCRCEPPPSFYMTVTYNL